MGAVAVTFRQTNLVWVFYFMVLSIIQLIRARTSRDALYNPTCDKVVSPMDALRSVTSLIQLTCKHLIYVVPRILMFLVTLAGCAAFLVWNDGIVLGDKSNHVAGLHFPQLFYYTSFLSFFSAPMVLTMQNGKRLLSFGWTLKR